MVPETEKEKLNLCINLDHKKTHLALPLEASTTLNGFFLCGRLSICLKFEHRERENNIIAFQISRRKGAAEQGVFNKSPQSYLITFDKLMPLREKHARALNRTPGPSSRVKTMLVYTDKTI